MAVTMTNEDTAGRQLSIDSKGGISMSRSFKVFTDDPSTSLLAIGNAPGVWMWARHPDHAGVRARKFDVSQAEAANVWNVTITYEPPDPTEPTPPEEPPNPGDPPKLPGPVWSGGSTTRQVPFPVDVTGKPVANSAGVPFPDATRDMYCRNLALIAPVNNMTTANSAINQALGKTNNASWAGDPPRTWLCTKGDWKHASFDFGNGFSLAYIELSFAFEYNPDGWDMTALDVGYTQKADVDGTPSPSGTYFTSCTDAEGNPTAEMVALDGSGMQMQPPPRPGFPPVTLSFKPYASADFTLIFGNPW